MEAENDSTEFDRRITEIIHNMRSRSDREFMYFIYGASRSSQNFSPYYLKLVPFEKIDKKADYVSISCNGVTYFSANKEPELVKLAEWEQQLKNFTRLKKLCFFKHFTEWKIFCKWRKSVARRRFDAIHSVLSCELIFVNKILGPALQSCQAVSSYLENLGFISRNKITDTHTLEEFACNLTNQLQEIEISLSKFRDMLKDTLMKACQIAYQQEGFSVSLSRPSSARSDSNPLQGKSKGKSLSYVDQDKMRNLSSRIARFLRLADYVIQTYLLQLLVNSVELLVFVVRERFNNLASNESSKLVPLCVLELTISSETLRVEPSEEDVRSSFVFIIRSWEKCILTFQPFLSDPSFRLFLEENQNKQSPCLEIVIQKHEQLDSLQSEMLSMLQSNFKHIHGVVSSYNSIAKSYIDNKNTQVESIRKEIDLSIFRVMLLNYSEQQCAIEKIVPSQSLGIFLLQLENFQQTVVPCLQELRHAVNESLPKVGRSKVLALSTEVQDAQAFLELLPKTTSNYVEYIKFLDDMPQHINLMTDEMNYVQNLHIIMQEFSVPCLKEDLSSFTAFKGGVESLSAVVEKRLSERDLTMKNFEEEMCRDITLLLAEVQEVQAAVNEPSLVDVESDVEEVQLALQQLRNRLQEAQRKADYFETQQQTYHLNIPDCNEVSIAKEAVHLRQLLWDSLELWESRLEDWETQVFHSLDPDEITATIEENNKIISELEAGLPVNQVVIKYKTSIANIADKLPVIRHLRNSSLEQRHWCDIGKLVGHDLARDEALTLRLLEEMEVFKHMQALQEISNQATCEADLNSTLNNVENQWESLEFTIIEQDSTYILGDTTQIQSIVDDTYLALGTISSSRFAQPIRPRVENWKKKLKLFGITLDEWNQCQENWCLLGKMFKAAEMRRKLLSESAMFEAVNRSWTAIMSSVNKNPAALKACTRNGLLSELRKNNNLQNQIIRYMKAYLESKRSLFPRFYFISDDELMDILSKPKDVENLQTYLEKCFVGIHKLKYKQSEQEISITSIVSQNHEEIKFEKAVRVTEKYEEWLGNLENSSKETIRKLIKNAISCFGGQKLEHLLQQYPQQVMFAVSSIMWCRKVEAALGSEQQLEELKQHYHDQKLQLLDLAQSNASPNCINLCSSLIAQVIQFESILRDLSRNKIHSSSSFEWQKRLRFYWCDKRSQCEARMGISTHQYGYEYVGICSDIAWTPTLDKSIFSILIALKLMYGGYLLGSPGYGKKEVIKTLSLIMAINFVLLPCSPSIKYKPILQLLSGVAQTGSWCCLCDVNFLDIDTLTSTSHQIQDIVQAQRNKQTRFLLEGRELKLHPNCAIFITSVPLQFEGITKLPESLTSLFRSVYINKPEIEEIAEVILLSRYFSDCHNLACKVSQIFNTCSVQLCHDNSYCFDTRNMKKIIVMMSERISEDKTIADELILRQLLQDVIAPRLQQQDADEFQKILNDILGYSEDATEADSKFKAVVQNAAEQLGLTTDADFIDNVLSLKLMLDRGQSVILIGDPGVGKTSLWKVLQAALNILSRDRNDDTHLPYDFKVLYPHSRSWGELFGDEDSENLQWKCGDIEFISKSCAKSNHPTILVLDGLLNSRWIEGLGTYLDKNGALCLGNLSQLRSNERTKILIETSDMRDVSPSLISRCNILHIDNTKGTWKLKIKSCLSQLKINEESKSKIESLCHEYVEPAIELLICSCRSLSMQTPVSIVSTLCSLLESQLIPLYDKNEKSLDSECIQNIFTFSFVWSFLSFEANIKFKNAFRDFVSNKFETEIDGKNGILNKYLDTDQHWQPWQCLMSKLSLDPEAHCVFTEDFVKFGFILKLLVSVNHPAMIFGPSGCGKSTLCRWLLQELETQNDDCTTMVSVNMKRGSGDLQTTLRKKLERRSKGVLGAPRGKRIIFCVEDVSVEQMCNSQSHLEVLRQLFDHSELCTKSSKNLTWVKVEDVLVTAVCNKMDSLCKIQDSRFLRHFTMLSLPDPSADSLVSIYGETLNQYFTGSTLGSETSKMIDICVSSYEKIRAQFLPVPGRLHYVFTQRCLDRTVRGIMRVAADSIKDLSLIIKLVNHELERELLDRMITEDDKIKAREIIQQEFIVHFGDETIQSNIKSLKFSTFADFLTTIRGNYANIENTDMLLTVMQEHLQSHNERAGDDKLKLVIFQEFAEHVVRLTRALHFRSRHCLVLGSCGTGRRSVAKFAAYLCGHRFVTYNVLPDVKMSDFQQFLQDVILTAVSMKQETVLIISDNKLMSDEILECLIAIITLGNITFLCNSKSFQEKIIQIMKEEIQETNTTLENHEHVLSLFVDKLKRKLHIVICVDVEGNNYRRLMSKYPELSTYCSVNWIPKWSSEALVSIAKSTFRMIEVDEETRLELQKFSARIHEDAIKLAEDQNKQFEVTTNMFIEILQLFYSIYKSKLSKLLELRDKCSTGLKKLNDTMEVTEEMRQQLSSLEPELRDKSAATDALMKSLLKEQSQVEKVRQAVAAEELSVKAKSDETQAMASEAQKDLDEAIPAIEASIKALETVERNDLKDIRGMSKPPALVKFVLEAVCLLMGCKTDWGSIKALTGDSTFVKRAMELDKDSIPDTVLRKLKEYVEHPNFLPEIMETQSRACRSFCMWVRAVDGYSKTYRAVLPKKKRLESTEAELSTAISVLRGKQQRLAETEGHIARLESQYDTSVAEQGALQAAVELTTVRLTRAGNLAGTMQDEHKRWQNALQEYTNKLNSLPGDMLLSSAYIVYLGTYTSDIRDKTIQTWHSYFKESNIPICDSFSLQELLSNTHEIQHWLNNGLPNDTISIKNAIITLNSMNWPLLIDPQEQGYDWIKQNESGHGLIITSITHINYLECLNTAIKENKSILIQDVFDHLPNDLAQILMDNSKIEKISQPNNKFKLYLSSRLSRPKFHTEIYSLVTIVDFSTSYSALEEIILCKVMQMEANDIEQQISTVQARMRNDRREQDALEQSILDAFCSLRGDLLDDETLINTLNKNKSGSDIINISLEKQEVILKSLHTKRENYRGVATRGAILFNAVTHMGKINTMYQCSMRHFLQIFYGAIKERKRSDDELSQQIAQLELVTTQAIFNTIVPGLQGDDKLTFSFVACCSILRKSGEITEHEWSYFVSETQELSSNDALGEKVLEELTENLGAKFHYFENIANLLNQGIQLTIGNCNINIILKSSIDAENSSPNEDLNVNLTEFQKLMLIKIFKSEELKTAMQEFVKIYLKSAYLINNYFSLKSIVSSMKKLTPLIFILGHEPMFTLSKLSAESRPFSQENGLCSLVVSPGKEGAALKIMKRAITEGLWLYIQNCHISPVWLEELTQVLKQMWNEPNSVNDNFRLFLSTESTDTIIPLLLLQNSLKFSTEPPRSWESNMKSALSHQRSDFIEDHVLKNTWSRIIYGLCHFDLIIRERGYFGPQGWSTVYQLSGTNLTCAIQIAHILSMELDEFPVKVLIRYVGEMIYGNEIVDERDMKCLLILLNICVGPQDQNKDSLITLPDNLFNTNDISTSVDVSNVCGLHETTVTYYKKVDIQTLFKKINVTEIGLEKSDSLLTNIATRQLIELLQRDIIPAESSNIVLSQDKIAVEFRFILMQECKNYDRLVQVIEFYITALDAALSGRQVMSESLYQLHEQIRRNQVPHLWKKYSFPSTYNLKTWLECLKIKIQELKTLQIETCVLDCLPILFFPRRFLYTMMHVETCQQGTSSIDRMKLIYCSKKSLDLLDNVHKSLHLDCAAWNDQSSSLDLPTFDRGSTIIPISRLIFDDHTENDTKCECSLPLFRTKNRNQKTDNYIAEVYLPSKEILSDYWILLGTSLHLE